MNAEGMTQEQKPIVLWAVPRSVSTAFEKTFTRLSEFDVVHEPFTDCYYFSTCRQSRRYGDAPAREGSTPRLARNHVLRPRSGRRVFVKELCFQAEPYIDEHFLRNVTSSFIIRSPDVVLSSLSPLKPDFTEHEFGFTAFERLWSKVAAVQAGEPILIEGNKFRADSEQVLKAYCDATGVAYQPAMLTWDDGHIRAWGPDEYDSQAKWHATLEKSHGVLPPSPNTPPPIPADAVEMMEDAWRIYQKVLSWAL